MSAAYIVVHARYVISVVGAYSGYQAASDKAIEIAKNYNPALYIKEPKEQKKNDGSIEWEFSQAPLVFVSFRQIESPTHKQMISVEPKDDPKQTDLPAGWDYNGKPITVEEMLEDPSSVKEYDTLTTKEAVALVTARIRKRPNYLFHIPGWAILNRDDALRELSKMSHVAEMIIKNELDILNKMCSDDY